MRFVVAALLTASVPFLALMPSATFGDSPPPTPASGWHLMGDHTLTVPDVVSVQGVGTLFAFGTDDRIRVSPTTVFPADAMTFVSFTKPNDSGTWSCSGVFIGPRLVLTAAHCVYTYGVGFDSAMVIYPGEDGVSSPFGYQVPVAIWAPGAWIGSGDTRYDYGLALLPSDGPANLGIGVLSDASLANPAPYLIGTLGYPGDKPYGTQWAASTANFYGIAPYYLRDQMDIVAGQSGSPITWPGGLVVGVVSRGVSSFGVPVYNEETRVTVGLLDDIIGACTTAGCTFSYYVEPGASPTPTITASPSPTATPSPTSTATPTPTVTPTPTPTGTTSPTPTPAKRWSAYLPLVFKAPAGTVTLTGLGR